METKFRQSAADNLRHFYDQPKGFTSFRPSLKNATNRRILHRGNGRLGLPSTNLNIQLTRIYQTTMNSFSFKMVRLIALIASSLSVTTASFGNSLITPNSGFSGSSFSALASGDRNGGINFNLIVGTNSIQVNSFAMLINTYGIADVQANIWYRPDGAGFTTTPSGGNISSSTGWSNVYSASIASSHTPWEGSRPTLTFSTPIILAANSTNAFFVFINNPGGANQHLASTIVPTGTSVSDSNLAISGGVLRAAVASPGDVFATTIIGTPDLRRPEMIIDYNVLSTNSGGEPPVNHGSNQVITFIEDDVTTLTNPERGWFRSIEPTYATDTPAGPLSGSALANWKDTDKITLVRKYYLLKQWTNSPLPQTFLDEVAADFATCRAQGFKLILRFHYNFNQNLFTNDATLGITLQHIQQLGPVLQANADVIDHMHCGFIGKWGEMHTSGNGHVLPNSRTLSASGQNIVLTLLSNSPLDRMVGLRYPTFKQRWLWPNPLQLAQAYTSNHQARLGGYNQGIMYDATDYGTYASSEPEKSQERAYWQADSDATFMSGEPAGSTAYSLQNPIPEMALIRLASLNMNQYDAASQGLYTWWQNNGYYSEITKRLGYRFVLEKLVMPTNAVAGSNFTATLSLRNEGFAALHNPRDFTIGLRLSGSTNMAMAKIASVDPRMWRPGLTNQLQFMVHVPNNATAGTYDLLMGLPDPKATLGTNTNYAIRCANQSLWEAGSGLHKLGTINISAAITAPTLITGILHQNDSVILNFQGAPGISYVLQATTNLPPNNWLTISTNTADGNGVWSFTDFSKTNYSMRFYRAFIQ